MAQVNGTGERLRENKRYATPEKYPTEGGSSPSKRALKAREKLSRDKAHFHDALSKHIVQWCVKEGGEKIAVGNLSDV